MVGKRDVVAPTSFPRFIALVKNLRGIVVVGRDLDEAEQRVAWLLQRFRYRNVGVSPAVLKYARELFKNRLRGKPFVKVVYPTSGLERYVRKLVAAVRQPEEVVEPIMFASMYVSPLLLLGESALEAVRPLIVNEVRTRATLDTRTMKLHMRIVDYTVLDFYNWATSHGFEGINQVARLLEKGDEATAKQRADKFVKERKQRIEKDRKRYWRLLEQDEGGRTVVVYLDLAQVALQQVLRKKTFRAVWKNAPEEYAAMCAILAGIVV